MWDGAVPEANNRMSVEGFHASDVLIRQPLHTRNVVPAHQMMTIALVDWQRDAVGTGPHDVARVLAVFEAERMADFVKTHVVNHHVAHEWIFSDASPDGRTEPVFIWPNVERYHRVTVLGRWLHAAERSIFRPWQPPHAK